jgi:hypothetical protein
LIFASPVAKIVGMSHWHLAPQDFSWDDHSPENLKEKRTIDIKGHRLWGLVKSKTQSI